MREKIKFGTDGWRGIIGKDFNLRNVEAIAQAIADYLSQRAKKPRSQRATKVAVGYDTRRLSPSAAKRISQILAANKIKVILTDRPLPTQVVSYTVRSQKCIAGIMVTASHNPWHFNGIKIKGSFGGTVESEITNEIEGFIFKQRPAKISISQAKREGLLKISNLVSAYLEFLQGYLEMPILKKGRLNILVDSMHGTANAYIAKILAGTGCKVTTLHQDVGSSFTATKPEPIQSCLKEASSLMQKRHFDLCLACDGDADRIAALDERGEFINPQQIISLLLLHLIRYRKLKGAVVKTVAGTTLLERIARRYKLKLYETPVGFKHISHLMRKKDILIGGEEAGGIGFKHYLPERDGILAGLLLLEMMIAQAKPLSALLDQMHQEFGRFFYLRKDLKCPASSKTKVKVKLAKLRRKDTFLGARIKKIRDYDGLKFYLVDDSWILFRLSGTEPLLRIYAESSSLARTKRLIAEGQRLLNL